MANKFLGGVAVVTTPASYAKANGANDYAVQIVYTTALPTSITINLVGSNDATNWLVLGSTTDVSATTVGFQVADKPYKYVGMTITAISAGSCTAVTGYVQWEGN